MKDKNKIILGSLMIIIAIIIFAYATIIKDVSLNKVALKGKEHWNIEISSVYKNKGLSSKNAIENARPIINGTSISFDVSIPNSNSKIVYDIIVTNKGTLSAKLVSMPNFEIINSSKPSSITYSIEPINNKETLLRMEKHYFRLTIQSSINDTNKYTKPATIYFDYKQA